MTSSSTSEASPAASMSQGRQEDAKDSACPMLASCQTRQEAPPPLGRSSPSHLLTLGCVSPPSQAGRQRAHLPVAASILLDSSPEVGEQPQCYQTEGLAQLGEPHSSARNGCATINTYGLVMKS